MTGMTMQVNELARLLQGRHAQTGVRVINILLVILIAAQLASLTWALLPGQEPLPVPVANKTGTVSQAAPGNAAILQIPELHLMGVPTSAAPVQAGAPVDAPDTQLRLTLRGALASDNKQDARAIIADSSGKEDQYAIGDTVPGNAELSEVYADRVILKRSGRYETLRLPVDGGTGGGNSSAAPRAMALQGSNASGTPAERLRQVREQIRSSPNSLYGMIRAAPKEDADGKLTGYVVTPGQDAKLFAQVGLQNGDVVTEVNNLSLADPNNATKALKSLQSGEQVTVKLLRNGVEQTLTIEGQ